MTGLLTNFSSEVMTSIQQYPEAYPSLLDSNGEINQTAAVQYSLDLAIRMSFVYIGLASSPLIILAFFVKEIPLKKTVGLSE